MSINCSIEENKENMGESSTSTSNKTFLDDMDVSEDTAEKVSHVEKKVVIMNVDKTKTNDEIEDYLYDSYPDAEIETFKVFRHVPYRVLVIFNSKAKADQFLEAPLVQGEKIGFKDKIKKISLRDYRNQAADRKQLIINTNNGLVVKCTGFKPEDGVDKIKQYMKDNHDEVTSVEKTSGNDVLLTFKDKETVEKFIALSYVKFCGQLITRQKSIPPAKDQKKPQRKQQHENKKKMAANKAATNKDASSTSSTPSPSPSLRLRGFKSPQTNFKTIQDALDRRGVKKFDIPFIKYNPVRKEAIVTLRNPTVAKLALEMLTKKVFIINSDKINVQSMDSKVSRPENPNNKPKQENVVVKKQQPKTPEATQKSKSIKGWTHY